MIIQPEWGTRDVNKYFYENEARRIMALNEIFGNVKLTEEENRILVWLAGWDEHTVESLYDIIINNVFRKKELITWYKKVD